MLNKCLTLLLALSLIQSALAGPTESKAQIPSLATKPTQALIVKPQFQKENLAFKEDMLQSRFTSWGIDPSRPLSSINLKESWKKFKKNKEVIVAVVDTGIQYDHPFLAGNIAVVKGTKGTTNFGMDFSSLKTVTTLPNDQHGHGTHVAGIIKSIYPEVKILALKYYNPQASGQDNLYSTIKALEYAVEANVDIINYSGGGPEPSVEELRVLKAAEKKGILVIAAAGNEKSNIDDKKNAYYPASYGLSNIITVAAHDEEMQIISSSNWGKNSVDIAAPGHKIRSAIPQGGAGYMTGTSQATAFVSGVVSLIKSKHPYFRFEQIKNIILSSSLKVKNFEGKILGGGKLDAGKAIEMADAVKDRLSTGRSVAKLP